MSVEVTPRGTRGFQPPRLPRPIMAAFTGGALLAHRILGDRMRVMGRPLLLLHTVGARSGRTRTTMLGWFPDTADRGCLVVAAFAPPISTHTRSGFLAMFRNQAGWRAAPAIS